MSSRTQDSGAVATRDMWGLLERPPRPLLVALLVALLVHLPLAPSGLSAWIRLLFPRPDAPSEVLDDEVVIPIELDMGLLDDEPALPAPESAPRPAGDPGDEGDEGDGAGAGLDAGVDAPPESESGDDDLDFDDEAVPPADAGAVAEGGGAERADAGASLEAGVDDAARSEPEAEAPDGGDAYDGAAGDASDDGDAERDAEAPVAEPVVDAAMPDAGRGEATDASVSDAATEAGPPAVAAKRPAVADPYAVAGAAATVGSKHPNVRIYLATDLARKTKLGTLFGELLLKLPQWQPLLGGTDIDPVKHFDHVLISGPQMRDPRHIVATVDFNVSARKMKQAIDRVVTRGKPRGRWIAGHGVPVAAIGPKQSQRAVLLSDKRLLVVLPADAEDQISQVKKLKQFKKSGSVIIAVYVLTPWRGAMNTALRFPKSIRWARLRLSGSGAGKYALDVDAEDADADHAKKNATELAESIEDLRPHPLIPGASLLGVYLFDKPTLAVDGARISMHVELTASQVETIMGFVTKWLKIEAIKAAAAAKAREAKARDAKRDRSDGGTTPAGPVKGR